MRLEVESGPDAGRSVDVTSRPVTIGRDGACDLVVHDEYVSAHHAQVRVLVDGRVEVTDLSSTNGTWVNGDRLAVPALVPPGTRVLLGAVTAVIVTGAPGDDTRATSLGSHGPPASMPLGGHASVAAPGFGPGTTAPGWPVPGAGPVDAGPIAGGNIEMSGENVAGRDLHYHEGFRIRSRMRRSARRLLWFGLVLVFVGWGVAFAGIASFNQSVFEADADTDFSEFGAPFMVAIAGMGVGVIGLVIIVVSLVMKREQVQEAVVPRRRR